MGNLSILVLLGAIGLAVVSASQSLSSNSSRYEEPSIAEQPHELYETVFGNAVTISCRVTGAPEPVVTWYREGEEVTGDRYTVLGNGDLQIEKVQFSDAGQYSCLASNGNGSASSDKSLGHLRVKRRTVMTVYPEDKMLKKGTGYHIQMQCDAEVDRNLTLSVEWFHNGQKKTVQHGHSMKVLTISHLSMKDAGFYTCVAKTSLDAVNASAIVTVQDVPNPPKLIGVNIFENSVFIEWQSTNDNGSPILKFTIMYSNLSSLPEKWIRAVEDQPAENRNITVEMIPWANYTFKVMATNAIGDSAWSSLSQECVIPANVPLRNPADVKGYGDKPDNLVISWKPFSESELSGTGFFYRVFWKRKEEDEDWIEDIDNFKQGSLVIQDLPNYTPFIIKVEAHNSLGKSKVAAEEIIGYSGEGVPLEAPRNLSVVQVFSSTAAELSWNPVTPESVRGNLKGYKIQTWVSREGVWSKREMTVFSHVNQTQVNLFRANSENIVQIAVFNGKYQGPFSEELHFFTPYEKRRGANAVPKVVTAQKHASLQCEVENLSGHLDIDWLHDSKPVDFENDRRICKRNDFSLHIEQPKVQDSGVYTCVAKTQLGLRRASMTLVINDVPNAPKIVSVKCYNFSAAVEWEPTGHNKPHITSYIIRANISYYPGIWNLKDVAVFKEPKLIPEVVAMDTWGNYTFQVTAVNSVGSSLPSGVLQQCVQAGRLPASHSFNLRGCGDEPGSLVISWNPMSYSSHNGPGFFYRISWGRKEEDAEDWSYDDIHDWKQSQYIAYNVSWKTAYSVAIRAHNRVGHGTEDKDYDEDHLLSCVSGYGVPQEPPGNLTVVRVVDAQTAVLAWMPVSTESLRGKFKGYRMETWIEEEDPKANILMIRPDVTEFVVDNLVGYSKNLVRMAVYNGKYYGPYSDVISIDTPEGTPGIVDNVTVYSMSTGFRIFWKEPKVKNGIITGYRISGHEHPMHHYLTELPIKIDTNATSVKITGLRRGVHYRVIITAITSRGSGVPHVGHYSTTHSSVNKPEFTLENVATADGKAAVNVTVIPNLRGNPGSYFVVRYEKIYPGEELMKTENIYDDYVVISGLDPGNMYKFQVMAFDDVNYSSNSDVKIISTLETS